MRVSLLFAEVLLIWHAANYLASAEPKPIGYRRPAFSGIAKRSPWLLIRAAIAAVLTELIAGFGPGLPLAAAMLAGCILLPAVRLYWIPRRFAAEFEVLANMSFAALAFFLITHFDMQVQWGLLHTSVPDALFAACTAAAALLIFGVRGGTYIVRGILDKAGTMPPAEQSGESNNLPSNSSSDLQRALTINTVELNHGRLIGYIERLIPILLVANGQYTALAFFFAAKGLIRSKDIEKRPWADYRILGSLTSFVVAVAVGLLVQALFNSANP